MDISDFFYWPVHTVYRGTKPDVASNTEHETFNIMLTPTFTVIPVQEKPQLTISQTALKKEPKVGEEVIITVSIANTGSGAAKSIQLTENIPSSVSVSCVSGAGSTGTLVTWRGELRTCETHIIQHTFRIIEEKNRFFPVIVRYEDADGNRHETSTTIYISANVPEIKTTTFPEVPLMWMDNSDIYSSSRGIPIIVAIKRRGGEEGAEMTMEENN